MFLVTISALVPPTRVLRRITSGWLIKSLSFSAQHTKWKHNMWLEVGVSKVGTSSWLTTSRTRRVRCLWCWTYASQMSVGEVPLHYLNDITMIGPLMRLSLTRLENIALTITTIHLRYLLNVWHWSSGRLHSGLCAFYSYRFIGKLTAFLQVQQFRLRNQRVDCSTSVSRYSPPNSNLRLGTFLPRLQLYV